ncbi:Uncharacterized protein BP5553_04036 [Venustampulla echinocandica]|uniref:LDB19 N-terminal domain-containing protein n=1 Tax=Venustampulla echinocandica TaxID=2656787 RepID=A0A370TVY7_9HELO|nr:Uncharacterized protein BP5553_04036 [Venustampulla echinocandica]RDL39696.1 Uncharacterized protein BP5553_04036 [Venustampulla echinocandica]
MPHKVIPFTFFRSQSSPSPVTHSVDLPAPKKPSRRQNSKSKRASTSRTPSSSNSSLRSERSWKMPDSQSHKRLSFPNIQLHGYSPKSSSKSITHPPPAVLNVVIESPPLVVYGPASSSTGALLSGQLKLNINDDSMVIDSFVMRLALEVTNKKPFHAHCQECMHQTTDLNSWTFLQGPATLKKGEHNFPFSFLLPGHLPASMKGSLSTISYALKATMSPKHGEVLKLSQPLDIKRAIYPSEFPRHSIRIFPPTNLTANCELPPVIHPIGETTVSMRMDGVVKRNSDTKTQTHWKLKRLTWRLDETQKNISPACPKHAAKLGNVEDGKKGIEHQDTRTIGTEEIKSGWKADYSTPDGRIELEFPFSVRAGSHPVCDMKAQDGTEVSHTLVVEMIVAEEFAPIKKPTQVTPTGAARVLRMHFNITLTERAGLGISWDEEQPPLYENVPASPPAYGNADIYDGEPIPDYYDLSPLDDGIEDPVANTIRDHGEGSSRTS